jgi:methylase of polypeptide subunit release factors
MILTDLCEGTPHHLRPGVWLCFKGEPGQGDFIRRKLERNGAYCDVEVYSDIGENSHVLWARCS